MRLDSTFNYHDLVGLRVQTDSSFAHDYFESEYGPAIGATPPKLPSVLLRWAESSLPRRPDASYRLKVHKGLARWYYRVEFGPEDILIEAAGNRPAVPMVHHMLVHGCLRYLCSTRDALLLHAAAIALREGSLVFAGSGGVGKTTVSSMVLDKGEADWALHADDYVFLTSTGDTFSYPSRAHLYSDFLKGVPSASSKMSFGQRVHLAVFGVVRRISGEWIKWPLRVEPNLLWPERISSPHAKLHAMLLLESSPTQAVSIEPIADLDDLVDQLVHVNFYEARHTIALISQFAGSQDLKEEWRARERMTLHQALQHTPAYRLSLPPVANIDRLELVSKLQQLASVEDGRRIAD